MMMPGQSLWARRMFYFFLMCFSLLPLSFTYLGPILVGAYAVMSIYFFWILTAGWNWKPAVAGCAVLVYSSIYVIFGAYSVLFSNAELELIFKDSVGFLFYPAYFPLIALMVAGGVDSCRWERFLVILGIAISIFHVAAYLAFFQLFDALTFETLTTVNETLKNMGVAAKYATGVGGVLRADSSMGVWLVIPVMIVFRNTMQKSASLSNLVLMAVLAMGIVVEGHRALLIAVVVGCFMYAIWMVFMMGNHMKILKATFKLSLMFCVGVLILAALYGDNLALVSARFFDLNSSNATGELLDEERSEQITPLIDEIKKSPILGNGFGANASVIRNAERPYMYEMDYLAIVMKLGTLGGFLYFSTYAYLMYLSIKRMRDGNKKMVYFFAGLSFLIFAGTNGGLAMSVFSTLFHLYLMIGISVACYTGGQEQSCKINSM